MTEPFLVAGEPRLSAQTFRAHDPAAGGEIETSFAVAGERDVADACGAAEAAFEAFHRALLEARARLLEGIADGIAALGEALTERGMAETGLPRARLEGERGRTVGQLRLFAAAVREGGWQEVRIDPAQVERQPLPKPDLRLMKRAIGPVAVFGASNFPLAFSVAGGDTASAFAAGCPVVVKGHPAHPGLSLMVGRAISAAVAVAGLPAGVFSLLSGPGNALGEALVRDPRIMAVGFTGSRGGGLALARIAAARPVPIPVYAEMSSVNPVILLPAALKARPQALAEGFVASLTFSAGQLCTNPGLVFALEGPGLEAFLDAAAALVTGAPAATLLTGGIAGAYHGAVQRLGTHAARAACGQAAGHGGAASPMLFTVDAAAFAAEPALQEEVFGHASVIVRCADEAALVRALSGLEGQLTATLHCDPADEAMAAGLLPLLERKAGRILANGWPTGVEVSPAMVHGGPYPATTDSRTTSVGTLAIDRFLRPVCYQNLPDALLPPALRRGG